MLSYSYLLKFILCSIIRIRVRVMFFLCEERGVKEMGLMKYVEVTLDNEHFYKCTEEVLARQNENRAVTLRLKLTDEMLDKNIYIDFQKPNGEKLKSERLEVDLENKTADYEVTNQLTDQIGTIVAEIVIHDDNNMVWKSTCKKYKIVESISATEDIEAEKGDWLTQMEELVDDIERARDEGEFDGYSPTIKEKDTDGVYVLEVEYRDENGEIKTFDTPNLKASGGIGENLEGLTVEPIRETTVVAEKGAERFNDYRDRTFSGNLASTGNIASGNYSHAEGTATTASGDYSHAEGMSTTASGDYSSHAEGCETVASGNYGSHAEGFETVASALHSHAEGYKSEASGEATHAEGFLAKAKGNYSHAEGSQTEASGKNSHAEGKQTIASSKSQHVQGEFNIEDEEGSNDTRGKYAHIVGNGTSDSDRSNAHTIDWNGLGWFKDLKVGGTGQDDGGAKRVATEEEVNSVEEAVNDLDNSVNDLVDTVSNLVDSIDECSVIMGEASGLEIEVEDSGNSECILNISGNSEQDSRSGKNKLPQDSFTTAQTINGVTFTPNSDGSIKISGTSTSAIRLDLTYKLSDKLVVGKTYISSVGQAVSDVRIKVEEAKDGNWAANITGNINTPWVFNGLTVGDKVRASISISAGVTVDTTVYPQIEEGSTVTAYEPYGVQPSPDYPSEIRSVTGNVEVKVEGKNLALWEVGTFDQNTGADLTSTTRAKTVFDIVAGEEYVINIPYARFRNLVILNNADTSIGNYKNCTFNRSDNYFSFVSTISGKAKIVISNTDDTTNIDINQYNGVIQLERGSTPTQVEEYKTKTVSLPLGDIELRSTPDTRDTFERVDGVWNKVSNIGDKIINGKENETIKDNTYYDSENYKCFVIAYVKAKWKKSACEGYSDRFKVVTNSAMHGIDEPLLYFGSANTNELFIHLDKNEVPTVADFNTWLANNPIRIVFPLATPTYTPITDQALISALDELEQLILHKGYNYITATSVNGVKAHLDLEYFKDTKGLDSIRKLIQLMLKAQ